MKISAIVSDYDGTLCPTSSLYSNNYIPEDLYNILFDISKCIPIGIISSKDFNFIGPNVHFAKIISCIMGVETFIFLQKDNEELVDYSFGDHKEILDLKELKNKIRKNGLTRYYINQNDNAAFKKADLSINIKSDERIDTKLDSHYTLEFNELSYFLLKLQNENFNFTSM